MFIRLRILESPAFERVRETRSEARMPIVEVLTQYPKQVLMAAGARMAENGAFYIYSAFVLVYATQHSGVSEEVVLRGTLIGAICALGAIPFFGALSDRVGRRPVYLFGAVVTALFAYPLFVMLDTQSSALVYLALIIAFVFSHAAMYGPQGAFLSELFGTRVRYSGASLGAQVASIFAGGLAPIVATWILREGYGRGALAAYVIAMALVTIVAVTVAAETAGDDVERL
jgi:MFS family permease